MTLEGWGWGWAGQDSHVDSDNTHLNNLGSYYTQSPPPNPGPRILRALQTHKISLMGDATRQSCVQISLSTLNLPDNQSHLRAMPQFPHLQRRMIVTRPTPRVYTP